MSKKVENINVDILRKCREQMVLSINHVEKKVPTIKDIEAGKRYPTFKQLDTLAEAYKVPRWVFVSKKLPEKYDFAKSVPVFRKFVKGSAKFSNWKIRGLVAQVERLRNLVLEIQMDLGEPISPFLPPKPPEKLNDEKYVEKIRNWLEVDNNLQFPDWKEKLEQKGIFIFMTSKYKSWSYVEKEKFRGLSTYHSTLPIIIINSSDAKKAYSFTLLHELGHLIRKENEIDGWDSHDKRVEKECDQFAGQILMPTENFLKKVIDSQISNLQDVEKLSKKFHVSKYACLVRLQTLKIISREEYLEFEKELQREYSNIQDRLRRQKGGPSRDRATEAFDQYGKIYARALFQAYYNNEIGLHRLYKSFDLKLVSQVEKLEKRL